MAGTRTVSRMTTYCAPCLADLALVREAVTAVSGTASCMAHAVLLTHPGDSAQRRLQRLSELRTSAEGKLATASTGDVPAIEILIQEYALAGAMDMTVPLRELAGDRAPRPAKSRRGRGGRPENGEHGERTQQGERPARGERPERTDRPERGDRRPGGNPDASGTPETAPTTAAQESGAATPAQETAPVSEAGTPAASSPAPEATAQTAPVSAPSVADAPSVTPTSTVSDAPGTPEA